jgi:site-specific DNA-methyltransferase (adenine-specific)
VKKSKFNIFPEMQSEDYNRLKSDLESNGFDKSLPITLYNGDILDGWNRYKVCQELDITPTYTDFKGNDGEAIEFAMRSNKRRNLTSSQWAAIASEAEDIIKAIQEQVEEDRRVKQAESLKNTLGGNDSVLGKKFPQTQPSENKEDNKTAKKVADLFNTNQDYIKQAKKIKEEAPELLDKVKSGELNIKDAKAVTKLDKPQREKVIESLKSGEAKNVNSAIKKIEQKELTQKASEKPLNEFVHEGDAITVLKTLSNLSVDCVVCDPPYGVSYEDTREVGLKKYKDEKEYALDLLEGVCIELKRVCKEGAHMYFFTGFVNMFEFKQILSKYFHVQENPIVWVKNNHTLCDFNKRYASKCEYIWFAHNSKEVRRKLNYDCSPDVLNYSVESGKKHSAQKPVELLKYLIKNSSVENEVVLDPFAGSGSTLVAAKESGRSYIGIELEHDFIALINERLED